MKISFLTSSHFSFDDRIYHHMAKTLLKKGYTVQIISSKEKLYQSEKIAINSFDGDSISKIKKIKIFIEKINQFKPSLIICSEPLTVYVASKYCKLKSVKIIYDITEFYPSKKNLRNYNLFISLLHFFKFLLFFMYALKLSDGFLFGEFYKSIIPKKYFPKKPSTTISYYPKKELFTNNIVKPIEHELNLCYSGSISVEKGFINFTNVINYLNFLKPTLKIKIKIIGDFNEKDKKICKKKLYDLNEHNQISYYNFQPLYGYIDLIKNTDVFLDLRSTDYENKHCLPIKLFYYMALKRPIIFSNLKSISNLLNIYDFGYLVNPKQSLHIANLIINYINDPKKYLLHSNNAREQFIKKYNWECLDKKFLNFINKFKNE